MTGIFPERGKSPGKRWTLLIYAAGNNELEPEMYKSFLELGHCPVQKDITVLVELGRAPQKLVQMLRPNVVGQPVEDWNGVRRYVVSEGGTALAEELGNINMADPYSLLDFLVWGVNNFPSDQIMVILSGHGAGFMGALTDNCHGYPMIMSIQGLTGAINRYLKQTGKSIDILVLDACYMNLVEVWYEVAVSSEHAIIHIISSQGTTPLNGIPWHQIVSVLKNCQVQSLRDTLVKVIEEINKGAIFFNHLLATDLVVDKFDALKEAISNLAHFIWSNEIDLRALLSQTNVRNSNPPLVSILDLLTGLKANYPNENFQDKEIRQLLGEIVVSPSLDKIPLRMNLGPSLYFPHSPLAYRSNKTYYNSLLFSHNSTWLRLLDTDAPGEIFTLDYNSELSTLPAPFPMPISSIIDLILTYNPNMETDQAKLITKKLGWLR